MELATVMDDSVDDGAVVAPLDGDPVDEDRVVAANVDTETDAVDVDNTRLEEPEGSPACRRRRSTRGPDAGAGRWSTRISPLRAICASVDLSASRRPLPAAKADVVVHNRDRKSRIEYGIMNGIVHRRHASL